MDPELEVEQKKGKKGKQVVKVKLSQFNLKQFPYNLRDGCVIGLKDTDVEDDWQTEEDKEAKAKYYAQKEEQKKDQIQGGGGRRYNDNVGIAMKLDFMQ